MTEYVEEKSQGRFTVDPVIVLVLNTSSAPEPQPKPDDSAKISAIADAIETARDATRSVADIVTDYDHRTRPLGLEEAERRGKKLRVGPPFGRARIGQEIRTELSGAEAYAGNAPSEAGGLIVVGST
ncbi:hypothetical protein [Pseudarthrobacter oxydans]|uniref:hypothetical protein n=1 Tax=Pseudarthrobacter oxydans TaxID=1671 RepID=UPI003D2E139C